MKHASRLLFAALLCLSGLSMGCGDDAPDTATPADTATEAAADGPRGTAAVTGVVNFTGTAPDRPELNMDRDCSALHEEPVHSQHVVVNDGGTLRYVFVYVKEGIEGTYPAPEEAVVLDQEGCMYEPHVFGIQTGQPLQILNSDPFLHNIHAFAEENRSFNFGMPNQGAERQQSFRVPEVMVRIKCDVHAWMVSYAGVLEHPFYSTTGDDGTFDISELPAGDYVIEAWHEEYGTQTQNVTVGDGETAELTFTFDGAAT